MALKSMGNCPIGVTVEHELVVDRRGQKVGRFVLDQAYVDALRAWGARPVFMPHDPRDNSQPLAAEPDMLGAAPAILSGLHGLVITGGDFDLPPALYEQKPHRLLGRVSPSRTAFEWHLFFAAQNLNMPILGICGGMQLINVARLGTLFQDLSMRPNTDVHEQIQKKSEVGHLVVADMGSRLYHAMGQTHFGVNSTHHQAIDRLGHDLKATVHATDGVVEAIESSRGAYCVGVQWHPEAMRDERHGLIYRDFVDACRQYGG